jgi:hypothetical protein
VNKPSTFLARLIQATVGKAAKRFAFSIVAAVSIGLPPFTPSSAEPAAFLPTDFAQEPFFIHSSAVV